MRWIDKMRGKGRPAGAPEPTPREDHEPPPEPLGRTVLRDDPVPAPTIAKAATRFQPNHEVTADLQIKRLLGSGAMGEVYLAHQRQWDVDVALKIPNDEILSDPDNRHRIVREAETWTDLGLHPNIAYCYYAQPLGDLLLLVIEYADGGNLRDWIKEGLCADLKTGLDLAIQFCHGLEHAHKKLVHRDIKPENIVLMEDGTLKITDFGIVRKALASPEMLQSSGEVRQAAAAMTVVGIGTPDYMAPEQRDDQSKIDGRVDIFAFGVCLHEMLCGVRPYRMTAGPRQEAPEPGRLRGGKGLPERLCRLMRRCVDWDRDRRPADAREVRAELCAVYEEEFGESCPHAELPEITSLADDWNNRALSYLALGRAGDAEEAWRTALAADPRHAESTYNYNLHRWRNAKATDLEVVRSLEGVIESDPSAWLPYYLLGQIHLERGDATGAKAKAGFGAVRGKAAAREEVIAAARATDNMAQSGLIRSFKGFAAASTICVSRDDHWAFSGGYSLVLWDISDCRSVRILDGHREAANGVGLSSDGRVALSGSYDKTLKLWDLATGQCLRTFEGHSNGVNSVCLSADGAYALSGSNDQTLKLWEVSTGQCLRTFEGHKQHVTSVCLSKDTRRALSGSSDNVLKLWDVDRGNCLRTLEGHEGGVTSVNLSVDERYALSGSYDKSLKLWDINTGQCLRTFRGHTNQVNSVSLSADGQYALSSSDDRSDGSTLRLWKVGTGRCLRTFESLWRNSIARFTKDARHIVVVQNGKPELWAVGEFRHQAGFRLSDVRAALAVVSEYGTAFADARRACVANDPAEACRALRRARVQPGHRRAQAAVKEWGGLYKRLYRRSLADAWPHWAHGQAEAKVSLKVNSMSMSDDGRLVLSVSSKGGTCTLWEMGSGRTVREFKAASPWGVSCLSNNLRYALLHENYWTGRQFKQGLRQWDVATGRCLRTLEGHAEAVRSVCTTADGRYALTGGDDKTLKLWDLNSGLCVRTFTGHSEGVRSVCLTTDGRHALSGSSDRTMKLWEVNTGRCLRTFGESFASGCPVDLSRDGRFALSGRWGKLVELWDVKSGLSLRTFSGHADEVQCVCLSTDGRHALSGGRDQTLRIWDVASGICLRVLEHASAVEQAVFSPDGQYALARRADGAMTSWFLDGELDEKSPSDWDDGARPYLDVFLRAHQPYAGALPNDRQPTDEEVTRALTRRGCPTWSEGDFKGLLHTLGCVGYGWLRPEGAHRELERMAVGWRDPD